MCWRPLTTWAQKNGTSFPHVSCDRAQSNLAGFPTVVEGEPGLLLDSHLLRTHRCIPPKGLSRGRGSNQRRTKGSAQAFIPAAAPAMSQNAYLGFQSQRTKATIKLAPSCSASNSKTARSFSNHPPRHQTKRAQHLHRLYWPSKH